MFRNSKLAQGQQRTGNVRWGLVAMLLGAPLPLVLLAFLFMGGCN